MLIGLAHLTNLGGTELHSTVTSRSTPGDLHDPAVADEVDA
jgi:hypothetical protein